LFEVEKKDTQEIDQILKRGAEKSLTIAKPLLSIIRKKNRNSLKPMTLPEPCVIRFRDKEN